nr:MAG TPA: type I neck protein [Caudoviricetes sp.]
MISIRSKGSFSRSRRLLKKMSQAEIEKALAAYGERGVALLSSATPIRSGLTANSWSYEIENSGGSARIVWTNSNIVGEKYNLAVLIQYGHGTGTGGYVTGIDYINPTLRPLFEEMANSIWKEVTSV